ncbi:MAG: NifU family protein [Candidatus Thermoplasmatota archaeon]|jgi:Fe-S cluster biogenesis protein NfuA|nr:NifU family protein [Candidatus Thermoplasmatota archaeon]
MMDKVKEVIDKRVNPTLAMDGGKVDLVAVEDGVVKIKMGGGCAGCPMRQLTLVNFIQKAIIEEIPEVKEVVAV